MMKNPVITGKIKFHKNKNAEKVKNFNFPIAHLCKALYNYHILRKAPVKGS